MNTYLNDNEKKVLASLYNLEDGAVNKIAKETLINRTTLYPILEKLAEKGLVSKIKAEGKIRFQPISKEEFSLWAERKEKELKENNKELLCWIDRQGENKKTSLASEIKYFEGMEGIKSLYADTWRENREKIIYAITDYKSAYENMGNFFRKDYFPARIGHGVWIKNLIPESPEGRKDLKTAKEMLREMKFIKLFRDLDIEVNIYNDKIAIVAFDKKNPSGVIIKNEKIAEAMKNIFEYLWKTAK
ncbi:MAG TPA: helix-turn-helix domain-containing protein [Candidatus Moranbacteria bacterium]|nr:helix-turn-helix domain-containing protein [Candidatus Moranbacteria bacterium]